MKDLIQTITDIISQNSNAPWIEVWQFKVMGEQRIGISFAASDEDIHQVPGQKPDRVGLVLDPTGWDLNIANFGGMGGRHIYREPDRTQPKEKYLYQVGVKIPFRTPKPTEEACLRAIARFASNWKAAIAHEVRRGTIKKKYDTDFLFTSQNTTL